MVRRGLPLLLAVGLLLSGCTAGQCLLPEGKAQEAGTAGQSSEPSHEESWDMDQTENVIYLAGGCFWGVEQLMQSIPGVLDAQSGYANGTGEADANYKKVIQGNTGFRETVRVEYDPEQVSLDALLLGVLTALGMLAFGMPYAVIVGVISGTTALIPILGGYIGAIVGAFLVFTVSPMQAFWFLVFIIVLQQVSGNLIYPRLVGSNIGLPGMWVLVAVTIGGGLGGIAGMLLGVPIMATIYALLREWIAAREKRGVSAKE